MAGTVDIIQRCFTGIETRAGVLHFNPSLPLELDGLQTTIRYRHHTLHIKVTHEVLEIASRPATAFPITVAYRGHFRDMAPGQAYAFRLIKPRMSGSDPDRRDAGAADRERAAKGQLAEAKD
jgi:alpha,alpha-trehalase